MNRKLIRSIYPRDVIRRHSCIYKQSDSKETGAGLPESNIVISNVNNVSVEPDVHVPSSEEAVQTDDNFRTNSLNIQMLSRSLFEQIFGQVERKINRDEKLLQKSLDELRQHGLPGPMQKLPDVDLKLPEILNGDIEEHFYELGRQQSEPYKALTDRLLSPIPQMPSEWNFCAGWTKYVDGKPVSVDYPEEESLIFDVEVCCSEGEIPVMATAASPTHWYSWASKDLCAKRKAINKKKMSSYSTDDLIPIESAANVRGYKLDDRFSKPKIVIGHNVSFDRARIKEQYWLEKTALRFIDTMSLHIAISGVTSYQKLMLKSGAAQKEAWAELTSLNNSLNEVHKFYCGSSLKKEERNVFVTGSLKDIRDDFQSLMTYCANDVAATHKILTHLWPEFLNRFPHPVTLAGMLELSVCYLPVNRNWPTYIENSQQTYDDMNVEAKLLLSQVVDKNCQLLHNEKYKSDLWLWSEDWQLKPFKLNKAKTKSKKKTETCDKHAEETKNNQCESEKDEIGFDQDRIEKLRTRFSELLRTGERLPVRIPYLAGYPQWYRKLCSPPKAADWSPGPQLISTSMKVVPKLLSLTWNHMPLHHLKESGWCFIVPYQTDISFAEAEVAVFPVKEFVRYYLKLKETDCIRDPSIDVEKICVKLRQYLSGGGGGESIKLTCGLKKLPHKDGVDLNVGNPLARDFANKFSDSELKSNCENAVKMIEISRRLSYWKNNKDRIEGQFVVWLKDENLPSNLRSSQSHQKLGVILPSVVVCGTLTRRAVESTWMTASNASDERIGSELRGMIQAPPGYNIVGADVDSQELWIASLIGDSYQAKEHGCTPFGWMTLSGQKADKTDMHSVTAKTMGISRNSAKVVNYARIYGAGEKFANRLLKQFIPNIEDRDAALIARKMLQNTKGRRIYELKPDVLAEHKHRTFTLANARQLCMLYNKSVDQLFQPAKWRTGSESAMFNSLEEIACSAEPRTPFLGARLTKALEPTAHDDQKFMPTRINWVVQSSAADFLHLLLVCMRWLIGPKIRFCLSFHDEVRYVVPHNQKYQVALALHVSNLLTRSFCVRRLDMCDLPQSVAFFSSVEVDTVLRKESTQDCITPSNPHGLSKGYAIPPGESLNILDSIRKADGKIGNVEPKRT
ncbi:DNA polymerase subunit gamma-1, mitochondrial [Planococcus citri]|uniref:DNA polymerase subunit gamma-1, mitochondrial n=1 Tax=Planococcus citri TaxID=170843 RepID=UPI0031F8AA02